MIGNPEFQRNIWLELTPGRLIVMPFVLMASFFLSYIADDYHLGEATAGVARTLFIVISMIWGTKLASESVMNEVRDNTWDWQRLSVLTPWELTFGKLFGSTIYTWYGAAICLFVLLVASAGQDAVSNLRACIALMTTGIFAHSVSLLASMTALQKDRKYNRGQASAFLVLGIMAAGPFLGMAMSMRAEKSKWFMWEFNASDFMLVTLICYTLWAILGINRLMRSELKMKNAPWVWFFFVFFNMFYVAGFFNDPQMEIGGLGSIYPRLFAAFFVSASTTYFMLFSEKKDFLTLRTLTEMVNESRWKSFLEHSPRWLLTLPIALATGTAIIFGSLFSEGKAGLIFFVIAVLFFILRDIFIIVFCNLDASMKKPDITAVLCLGLLYGLFPAIVMALKAEILTLFFWPRADISPMLGALLSFLESGAAMFLVVRRWQKQNVCTRFFSNQK